MARCASVLAWPYLAESWPERLVFVQYQRFIVQYIVPYCPFYYFLAHLLWNLLILFVAFLEMMKKCSFAKSSGILTLRPLIKAQYFPTRNRNYRTTKVLFWALFKSTICELIKLLSCRLKHVKVHR